MERNFETVMIEQCSPVLAGLKAAGLFRYETQDCKDLAERVRGWNARLGEKGLRVRVLKGCTRTHRYLVYVYRESRLREVLSDENVRAFLVQEGYHLPEGSDDCEPLLRQLSRRLCCEAEFPHEIGVFLGYPLTDVVGFIENQGRNFTCCGCWKAYGDRDAAERLFAQLNKCTIVLSSARRLSLTCTIRLPAISLTTVTSLPTTKPSSARCRRTSSLPVIF